jgi:Ca2+-binding RTX toxin-like protein
MGNDNVLGNEGNDLLIGSEGNDTLVGGSGGTPYMFFSGSGADFVFGKGDRITLQCQTYTLGSSGDGDALLLLSGAGTIELNRIAPAGFQPGFLVEGRGTQRTHPRSDRPGRGAYRGCADRSC